MNFQRAFPDRISRLNFWTCRLRNRYQERREELERQASPAVKSGAVGTPPET
jgi:hypothetical protein